MPSVAVSRRRTSAASKEDAVDAAMGMFYSDVDDLGGMVEEDTVRVVKATVEPGEPTGPGLVSEYQG